jgi:hypothetical protein
MSDLKISFSVTESHDGYLLNSTHSIKKQQSAIYCLFQYIGLLYHEFDAANEYDSNFTPAVTESFSACILKLGFPKCTPMHMLSTTDWKERMYIAWGFTNDEQKNTARELDYEEFHNYWPSLEFCEPGWDTEVNKWFSEQPCCTH